MNDSEREVSIEAAKNRLTTKAPKHIQLFYWSHLKELIVGRSPKQVSKMEIGFRG